MITDQAAEAVEPQDTAEDELLNALGPADQADSEADPQAEDPSEEAQEDQPAVSQKFRVKVKNDTGDDEERDLSLEELAAGYMQSADYTRKTQAVAAQEKQRQEQFYEAVKVTTQQAVQQVQALQQMVIQAAAPELQNVNWQQLAVEDPARYVQLQARQQQLNQVLGMTQSQIQQLQQQQQAAVQQQREQAMRHSLEYLSREIPGFNLEKDAKTLRETGKKYGFSDEEISGVIDGRFVHLLHDAAKWRELQAGKPKAMQKVTEAPKVIKPSAPQPKKTNQSALERLRKSGRPEELMNFL